MDRIWLVAHACLLDSISKPVQLRLLATRKIEKGTATIRNSVIVPSHEHILCCSCSIRRLSISPWMIRFLTSWFEDCTVGVVISGYKSELSDCSAVLFQGIPLSTIMLSFSVTGMLGISFKEVDEMLVLKMDFCDNFHLIAVLKEVNRNQKIRASEHSLCEHWAHTSGESF